MLGYLFSSTGFEIKRSCTFEQTFYAGK